MKPYRIEITLQGLPKSTNGAHGHWRAAHSERKKWRTLSAQMAIFSKPPKPLTSCAIHCTRFSSIQPDFDNLVIGFKSIIDGLKDAGIILDDKPAVVIERKYLWEKAKPGHGRVTVVVFELETEKQE